MPNITLTPAAVSHLRKILINRPEALGLRLAVKNAGCSGFSYVFDFADKINPEDNQFETEGISLWVDAKSLEFLQGTVVDCIQEGLNEYIKFRNPNVQGECGCGESFSIKKEVD